MFANDELRVIDENIEVKEENQEEVSRTSLEGELMQENQGKK